MVVRGYENKGKKIILLTVSILIVSVLALIFVTSTLSQQKSVMQSNSISNTDLDKVTSDVKSKSSLSSLSTTTSSRSLTSTSTTSTKKSSGSSGGGSSSGSSSTTTNTLTSSLQGGISPLAAGDPVFSNYWDNNGTQVGSGIARLNVSITGTNSTVGISIGGKNYSIDNNNWLDYRGTANYVSYGNKVQFQTNKTSISFYALVTPKVSKTMSIISKVGNLAAPNYPEYDLQFTAAGDIAFYVYQSSQIPTALPHCSVSMGPSVSGDAPYVAGQTYFIYAEYIKGVSCSLQINGNDMMTALADGSTNPGMGNANLMLGQRDVTAGKQAFNGSIDNFGFYNKSLSPIQINRIYNENNLGQSVPVLSYHRIFNYWECADAPDCTDAQEIVSKANFASQMQFLHDNGYHTITYKQWYNWTMGIGTIPEKPIIIDFDDGWYSVYANAKPIMDSYGFVGVEAIITDWADYAAGSGEELGAITWAQIQNLANAGWEIASHSVSHPDPTTTVGIKDMTTEQRMHEFNDSKNEIQTRLGVNVTTFIYPFDSYNVVTDSECGKYYSICSGYSAYPEHAGSIGDIDLFIFKNTNKIYSDGTPIGMRRTAISSSTTIADFKDWIDYSNNKQINSQLNENSGSIAYDSSGNGNNGAITGATWNNNLYHKEILLSTGTYPYYWWAYGNGTSPSYITSNMRSYTINATHYDNLTLELTSPTEANPLTVAGGSNISVYFNFLNESVNVTSKINTVNVAIGGQAAAILPSPITQTSNTYSASTVFTKVTDSYLSQAPAWNDAWDGTSNPSCLTNTLTSNDNYCTLTVSGFGWSLNREPWARFNFTIPENVNTITSIKITAEAKATSSATDEDVAFILANFATNSWVKFGADTRTETTRTVTYTSGFSDIIQNGQLVLLLEGADLDDGESIGIDYVSITVNATTSGGSQIIYIPTKGWQVNVTAPSGLYGWQDLAVNATYNGDNRGDSQIKAINYGCTTDNDCNVLDKNYCSGTSIMRDEGRCISNSCTVETVTNMTQNCDDALYCNGAETCNANITACVAGIAPVINDSLFCTTDSCDETADIILHLTLDVNDNLFCTVDSCDETGDVVVHAPIDVNDILFCTTDSCDETADIILHLPLDVNDSLFCTTDSCDETGDVVVHAPIAVNDSLFCTTDSCDETGDVVVHAPIVVDDSIACTTDSCDEGNDILVHTPQDSVCNDGAYCNGIETCSATTGCQAGISISCSVNDILGINVCNNNPDSNSFTLDFRSAFISSCYEATDSCTTGSQDITHTCNVNTCSAACDASHACADTECDTQDRCIGHSYYDYSDKPNSCLGDCSCENNACSNPVITTEDPRCIQENWCYQETANVSTVCGGLSTGSYSSSPAQWKDGSWTTGTGGSKSMIVTYSKPVSSTGVSLWKIKSGASSLDLAIPSSCWDYNPNYLQLRITSNSMGNTKGECYTGTAYSQLYSDEAGSFYEEAMNWKIII